MDYNLEYFLWQYVWLGLIPKKEVLDRLSSFNGKKTDPKLLTQHYNDLTKKQTEIIKKSKFSNDFSKLTNVFKTLNENGIISIHNAGSTHSAGFENINGVESLILKQIALGKIDYDINKLKGYCFYNEQSIEHLVPTINSDTIPSGSIYLAFGTLEDSTITPTDISKEICALLDKETLNYSWLGEKSRIEILNFVWTNKNNGINWENIETNYFIDSHIINFNKTSNKFKPGDEIEIKEGRFRGISGVITSIDSESESIKVLISFFGKETEIDIDLNQIKLK